MRERDADDEPRLRDSVVLSAVVVGLVVLLAIALYAGGQFGGSGHAEIGGTFKLVGDDGKPITDETMNGKPYLLFFGYTHCPDICPTTLFEMSEVMRAPGKDADHTGGLFITVDPERDTPAVMKHYLSNFDPHLRGVTGNLRSIHAVEQEFRVYAKKVPAENGDYGMDHSATICLMDKQGHFVSLFNLKWSPRAAAAELRKYF